MRKILMLTAALAVTGCATTQGQGQNVPLEGFQSVVVGETTKDEIIAQFGEPSGVAFGDYPNGSVEMMSYRSTTSESSPGAFIPLVGSLFMTNSHEIKSVSFGFDESGVLAYRDYNQNRSDYEGGLLNGEMRW